MPRKPDRPKPAEPAKQVIVTPLATQSTVIASDEPTSRSLQAKVVQWLAVVALLAIQFWLAEQSLSLENPTVDEVAHMPAGVTYWQTRTFKLYPHNPPLIKLIAAAPVVLARPNTAQLYEQKSWTSKSPSHPTFSQSFARLNIDRYFELFHSARSVMPIFLVLGGIIVFLWSSRLYGVWGGFLSLALWTFCPNMLAHGRLITTDAGSTAIGAAATYLFWRYLQKPGWKWALVAGGMLGLAQLSKFSMLMLLPLWPFLWLMRLILVTPRAEWLSRSLTAIGHALLILTLMILVIDLGYGFEGVGRPLGDYEFACKTLTRPVASGTPRPRSENDLLDMAWRFRINRFRDTFLAKLPVPLPLFYMQGFDEQKLEAEGLPRRFFRVAQGGPEHVEGENPDEVAGYSVYLNGEMRGSGWWYYYFVTLFYKLPEGTILLLALSLVPLMLSQRSPISWADEIAVITIPIVILVIMSFFTDINLGLRYVLAILPYLYISAGKVAPWIQTLANPARQIAAGLVAACLSLTVMATLTIQPHYLAYFNAISGGPDRTPARLIDSNLDWGQDLVNLKDWCQKNIPETPIGLAYFGQINPSIFMLRGEAFPWFLPPVEPNSVGFMYRETERPNMIGFAQSLRPGYYAVSASILYGLPWRLYDNAPTAWDPAWRVFKQDAFGYFRAFEPIARIGHSIYVYKLTQEDIDRHAPAWLKSATPAG